MRHMKELDTAYKNGHVSISYLRPLSRHGLSLGDVRDHAIPPVCPRVQGTKKYEGLFNPTELKRDFVDSPQTYPAAGPPRKPPRWPSGKRPPRERKVPGSNPACAGIFSGSSHTSDLKIGTPVATLPGAWRYRVSAGTGRPGVSIL